jgi:hypothetical protein
MDDDDEFVYVTVRLRLKPGQDEESVQEIVQEVDYSFKHNQIIDTEIVDMHYPNFPHTNIMEVS